MPQVINTNVMSLNAQRNLTTSGNAMATAIQRLSSGLRINSAKDDAAGLAISDRMTTQITGLNQAIRNANDGISLSQTTEGALQEVTNNLQRIRELAVQAANATNSVSDRVALDQEVQQRLQEINRIASQTSFNGRKVLDGTFGDATFQVGANVGETISIGFDTSMKTSAIGKIATAPSGDLDTLFNNGTGLTLAAGQLTVDGTPVVAGNYPTAASLITAINTAYTTSGGAGSIAVASGNEIAFTNTTNSVITIAGSAASTLGIGSIPAQTAGGAPTAASYTSGTIASFNFANVTGTGGTSAPLTLTTSDFGTTSATFTVDTSHNVVLNTDLTDPDGVADEIENQLGAGYSVANVGGTITITNLTPGSAAVAITAADAGATGAGINNGTGTAGITPQTNAKTFTVDGNTVSLTTDVTDITGLLNSVQGQLNTAAPGTYTVTAVGNTLKIATVATGLATTIPDIQGADAALITTGGSGAAGADAGPGSPGTGASTGVNAAVTATGTPSPQTFLAGEFTIQIGTGPLIDLAGTYDTAQDLAEAINSKVVGTYASVDANGVLQINAGDTINIGGGRSGPGANNLAFATPITLVAGGLDTTNVLDTAAANETILRIDAALTSVSTLRSTLGAIQNRFQSTINSLSAVSENLSASRSRILDTDFAAETAAMTRAQILQQAGTAMVAQANAVPQNVLSLLK